MDNIEALTEDEGGTITCAGGDNKCAEAYDKDDNLIGPCICQTKFEILLHKC